MWAGLLAPKETAPELIERLNGALHTRREAAGALIQVGRPAEMRQRVREEILFWRKLLKRIDILSN
jgi:tripartite-type tricarboxylate transporter receptor subunit TctC